MKESINYLKNECEFLSILDIPLGSTHINLYFLKLY